MPAHAHVPAQHVGCPDAPHCCQAAAQSPDGVGGAGGPGGVGVGGAGGVGGVGVDPPHQ